MTARALFGRDRHLRKRTDFERVQKSARRVTTAHYVLLVAAQSEPRASSRLGLIVTRKIGNAVARNRIKRVCRECFRLGQGLVPDGIDLVVVARPGAEHLGLREAQAEWAGVRSLLQRRAQEALARGADEGHLSRGPGPGSRAS